VKRLLHRIEHLRPGLRQVAGKIAQERGLAECSDVAVEDDAAEAGGVGNWLAKAA
jgi:hypothetical protein